MNEELDRLDIELWITYDAVNLSKTMNEIDEKFGDGRSVFFEDECGGWVEEHFEKLLEDYTEFIEEKLRGLGMK